jgi:hypothetical protein
MPLSFQKQPATTNPRLWVTGALGALAAATTATGRPAGAWQAMQGGAGVSDTGSGLWRMSATGPGRSHQISANFQPRRHRGLPTLHGVPWPLHAGHARPSSRFHALGRRPHRELTRWRAALRTGARRSRDRAARPPGNARRAAGTASETRGRVMTPECDSWTPRKPRGVAGTQRAAQRAAACRRVAIPSRAASLSDALRGDS